MTAGSIERTQDQKLSELWAKNRATLGSDGRSGGAARVRDFIRRRQDAHGGFAHCAVDDREEDVRTDCAQLWILGDRLL